VIPASLEPSGSNSNGQAIDVDITNQAEQDNAVHNATIALALWKENDYLCKNFILNGLNDELYDYYSRHENAKQVWDALEKKYDTEKAGAKKYAVSRYLKFQMNDEKSVEA
jgi:hypothetical protein